MNCDLSRGIARVRCFMNPGVFWSDGKAVSSDDILATFQYLASTDVNTTMKKLLSLVTVNDRRDSIEFATTTADTSLLDIFLFPILSSESIQKIQNATKSAEQFNFDELPTSGPYAFLRREVDDKIGAKKITIALDSQSKADNFIEKYVFYFFFDSSSLLKNSDRISLLMVPDSDVRVDDERFEKKTYFLPEYSAAFLNSERLSKDLRKVISTIIRQSAQRLDPQGDEHIADIFFSTGIVNTTVSGSVNMATALRKLGYVSKKEREAQVASRTRTASSLPAPTISLTSPFDIPTKQPVFFTGQVSDILL